MPPSCDHQMECNKEEAVRAREIAERKFAIHDFVGAKKFLIKAQSLFPDLDGVSQMLAVVDVHSVAAVKVGSNETDWYGILQVICSSQLFFSFPLLCVFLVGMCFSTPTLALHVFPLLHNKPLKDSVPGTTLNIVYGLLLQ